MQWKIMNIMQTNKLSYTTGQNQKFLWRNNNNINEEQIQMSLV